MSSGRLGKEGFSLFAKRRQKSPLFSFPGFETAGGRQTGRRTKAQILGDRLDKPRTGAELPSRGHLARQGTQCDRQPKLDKGCDIGYVLAADSCEGVSSVDACTVAALGHTSERARCTISTRTFLVSAGLLTSRKNAMRTPRMPPWVFKRA
jgi:hypothetical protein